MYNAKNIISKIAMCEIESAVEDMLACNKTADHCRISVTVDSEVYYDDIPKQEDSEEIFCIYKNSFDAGEPDAACVYDMICMWLPEAVDEINSYED